MWQVARGLAVWALLALASAHAWAQAQVLSVRGTETPQGVRFVLDLDRPVDFSVFVLPDPVRIVIDLPEIEWRAATTAPSGGLIERYRYGRFKPGHGRVVLDVARPVKIDRHFILPAQGRMPVRLVLDLSTVDEAAFRDSLKQYVAAPPPPVQAAPAPQAGQPPRPTPAQSGGGKRLVAVDPGHGGVDPGTIGRGGTYEKDVTLAAALEARRVLEATGRYRVILTRSTDVFIRLGERVAIARNAKAELFVSLHADSIATPKTRGASIYTLSNNASDKRAEALAAKENASDLIAGLSFEVKDEELNKILIDLTRRKTDEFSVIFARDLLDEIVKGVRVLEPRAHRSAGFLVLKAPDLPSVLVEMGYLSNRDDERFLTSREGRQRIAQAVVRAVDRYFRRKLD